MCFSFLMYSALQRLYRKDTTKQQTLKGGIQMSNEKKELIIRSIDDYNKLPEKDKMYILGYMYRALMDQESIKMQQTG